MIPFMTEEIYQNLVRSNDQNAPESIHLCDFPVSNPAWIDEGLKESMEQVLHIVVMGRAARNTANIKNRQPIGVMYVKAEKELDSYFVDIIEEELNVKEVVFKEDVSDLAGYSFKPQLRTVGPKYGKQLGGIRSYLAEVDGNEAMERLQKEGALRFEVDGTSVELAEEDLLIEVVQRAGFVTEADKDTSVVLDTNLTPELIEEGFVYEVISKIQTMRKEADFEVMDHIRVSICGNDKIAEIVEKNRSAIAEKVLADEIVKQEKLAVSKEWNVNGETVTIGIARL